MESHAPTRRLRSLVPTLARLGRARRASGVEGFTLIEMIVSIALASILILCAVTCFRMISKAVSTANAINTENTMLRTGMELALLDVDYWQSYANDRQPFNKGWTRVRSEPDNPATNFTDESMRRRPFQPVRYSPRTDSAERDPFPGTHGNSIPRLDYSIYNSPTPTRPKWNDPWDASGDYWKDPYNRNDMVPNPNGMLAHDPRSVSRQTLRPLRVPEWEGNDWGACWQFGYPRLAVGDYTLVNASDARDVAGQPDPHWPAGNNVSIPLDLTSTGAATDSYPDSGTLDIPLDKGLATYQPLLWTSLYHRLWYLGLYEYMTPGTPIFFNDARGNAPDWFTRPIAPMNQATSNTWGFDYIWDRDWQLDNKGSGGGNVDVAVRMGDTYTPTNALWGASRISGGLPFRPNWPETKLYSANADDNQHQYPFSIFFGNSGYWGGTEGYSTGVSTWGNLQGFERGDQTRNDYAVLSNTVWMPFNPTDVERADPDTGTALNPGNNIRSTLGKLDYVSKPPNAPVLTTTMFRYLRVAGAGDLTVARVSIDNPDGHRVELTLTPFGTTYRGARQHWRLYSKGIGADNINPPLPASRFSLVDKTCIGDFYDETNGPYYVP